MLQQEISKLWGNWRVEENEPLGEGAFGKVYRIEKEEFNHIYEAALKVIAIPKNESEIKSVLNDGMDEKSTAMYFRSFVEDIVAEIELMSRLKGNTNIVSYEDHAVVPHEGKIGWNIYIRMELLTPLFDYLRNRELSVKDVIQMGIDICSALEVCQRYNIIHRDIKPENIFVSDIGKYKLGDFGIARQLEKTSSGLSKKGTYTYMAPEVYKGEEYNSTVDLYSLGIVLYRYLNNNRTPFLPSNPNQIRPMDKERANVKRMSGEQIPKPCNADGKLAEIILKACSYNPKERYESAVEMKKALEEVLHEEDGARIVYPTANYKHENNNVAEEDNKTVALANMLEEGDKTVALASMLEEDDKTVALASMLEEDDKTIALASMLEEDDKTVALASMLEEDDKTVALASINGKDDKKEVNSKMRDDSTDNKKTKLSGKKLIMIIASVLCLCVCVVFVLQKFNKKSVDSSTQNLENEIVENEEENNSLVVQSDEEETSEPIENDEEDDSPMVQDDTEEENDIIENEEVIPESTEVPMIYVVVPNIVGMSEQEAMEMLNANGLVFNVSERKYSDVVENGIVVDQDIAADTSIQENTTISVVVSQGIEQVEVPNVKGESKKTAEKKIKNAKLKSSVSEEYSNTVDAGIVISQSIKAGKKVNKNSKVKIVVSLGKKEVKKPVYTQKPNTSTKNNNSNNNTSNKKTSNDKKSDKNNIDSWNLVN